MEELELEVRDGCAVYRPVGSVTLAEGASLVTEGILATRRRNCQRLLIDIRGLTDFELPTLADRYFFARAWARAGAGMRMAMVLEEDLIDPRKFAVMVAQDHGLIADVFTEEEAAMTWLLSEALATPPS